MPWKLVKTKIRYNIIGLTSRGGYTINFSWESIFLKVSWYLDIWELGVQGSIGTLSIV